MTLPLGTARVTCGLLASVVSVAMLGSGCTKEAGSEDGSADGISASGIPGDGDGDTETSGNTSADTDIKFDMPEETDSDTEVPCGEGQLCEGECEIPPHTPCDQNVNTPIVQAMGLNCPGDVQVTFATNGAAAGIGTRSSFGGTGAFPPQEGSKYVVIGSGRTDELDSAIGCSSDLGNYDPLTLPFPIVGSNVGAQTCAENPSLIGTGDCSNTIENQLASTLHDYTELRITADVPTTVNSFSYSLAYFSYEYPVYYLSMYNDMYIGWLESEVWTGNVSFDEQGAPISLNAGFLDYRDANAPNDPMCQGNCTAPELHGTCMQGHAGTKWLTTNAGVKPGETITLVLAIFDMGDSVLDSYAFVDNFQWGCDGDQPPSTVPIE
jgi:hypothetical protein